MTVLLLLVIRKPTDMTVSVGFLYKGDKSNCITIIIKLHRLQVLLNGKLF